MVVTWQPLPRRCDDLGQAVRKQVVLVGALLGDEALDDDPEAIPVAAPFGLDQVEKQVCSCHLSHSSRDRSLPPIVLPVRAASVTSITGNGSAGTRRG